MLPVKKIIPRIPPNQIHNGWFDIIAVLGSNTPWVIVTRIPRKSVPTLKEIVEAMKGEVTKTRSRELIAVCIGKKIPIRIPIVNKYIWITSLKK